MEEDLAGVLLARRSTTGQRPVADGYSGMQFRSSGVITQTRDGESLDIKLINSGVARRVAE